MESQGGYRLHRATCHGCYMQWDTCITYNTCATCNNRQAAL
jgi:hypothetical protein